MNLRTRVAVAGALGVFVVMVVVCTVVFIFYTASVRAQVDGNLVHAAQQAGDVAKSLKQASAGQGGPDLSRPVTIGGADLLLLPEPVIGTATRLGPVTGRDVLVVKGVEPPYFETLTVGGRRLRVYSAPLPNSYGVLVRTSRAEDADTWLLRRAALLLALLGLGAAAGTFLLGRLAAGRVLLPIAQLTGTAEHVRRTGDLGARLGSTRPDEVGRLARTFDGMLAELHDSVEAQRRLVADASHELRTPLTSLTTNLDLLADGDGLADPLAPQLVADARAEASELTSLINDLVDLARFGEVTAHREAVRLDLLVVDLVARAAGRAQQVRFAVEAEPCLVEADPDGLARAVSNLLDNAVKWSPPGGLVAVCVGAGTVTITDQGPGIDPSDQPHLFERFYRAPAARGLPGSGLGLAIVAQVARANEAQVSVRSGAGGSTFSLSLPTSA